MIYWKMYAGWACGAVGSALPWHGRGRRFEPDQVHQENDIASGIRVLDSWNPHRRGLANKQASLRRAVSTEYYALFHLFSIETAKNWKRAAERPIIARMLDHMPMSKLCTAKRDELNEYFKTRPAAGNLLNVRKHLHLITSTFVEMLQHPHTADYNGATAIGLLNAVP
jgi:hypothetical protein